MWLENEMSNENWAFLEESLKLCLDLPVTIDLLKTGTAAKVIKALSKDETVEPKVRKLAVDVVSIWKDVVMDEYGLDHAAQNKLRASAEARRNSRSSPSTTPEPPVYSSIDANIEDECSDESLEEEATPFSAYQGESSPPKANVFDALRAGAEKPARMKHSDPPQNAKSKSLSSKERKDLEKEREKEAYIAKLKRIREKRLRKEQRRLEKQKTMLKVAEQAPAKPTAQAVPPVKITIPNSARPSSVTSNAGSASPTTSPLPAGGAPGPKPKQNLSELLFLNSADLISVKTKVVKKPVDPPAKISPSTSHATEPRTSTNGELKRPKTAKIFSTKPRNPIEEPVPPKKRKEEHPSKDAKPRPEMEAIKKAWEAKLAPAPATGEVASPTESKPESPLDMKPAANGSAPLISPTIKHPKSKVIMKESGGFMAAIASSAPVRKKKKVDIKTVINRPAPVASARSVDSAEASPSGVSPSHRTRTSESPPVPSTASAGSTPIHDSLQVVPSGPPRKRVSWADETTLVTVHTFELEEGERVNVTRSDKFGDMKHMEMRRERVAMLEAKRRGGLVDQELVAESVACQDLRPYKLMPMDGVKDVVQAGLNSECRKIEMERQKRVLEEIYICRDLVKDTPSEPELETGTGPTGRAEPKAIPLNDVATAAQAAAAPVPAALNLPPAIHQTLFGAATRPGAPAQPQMSNLLRNVDSQMLRNVMQNVRGVAPAMPPPQIQPSLPPPQQTQMPPVSGPPQQQVIFPSTAPPYRPNAGPPGMSHPPNVPMPQPGGPPPNFAPPGFNPNGPPPFPNNQMMPPPHMNNALPQQGMQGPPPMFTGPPPQQWNGDQGNQTNNNNRGHFKEERGPPRDRDDRRFGGGHPRHGPYDRGDRSYGRNDRYDRGGRGFRGGRGGNRGGPPRDRDDRCQFFVRNGSCKHGDRCRYKH